MDYKGLSAFIADESDNLVYASDPDTYELYYVNNAIVKLLGVKSAKELLNKPCYQILQGKTAPCDFCTNKFLTKDSSYVWRHYNPIVNSWFGLHDKLIEFDGKTIRLEIASDITDLMLIENVLREKLDEERLFFVALKALYAIEDPKEAFDKILSTVGSFYGATGTYVFEVQHEEGVVTNTYEWCDKGIPPFIDQLQNIPLAHVSDWFDAFKKRGIFVISSVDTDVDKSLPIYKALKHQHINSLAAVPIMDSEENIIGFIGVNEPTKKLECFDVMQSIAGMIVNYLDKIKLKGKIKKLSYVDALTNTRNRHGISLALKRLDIDFSGAIGVVCTDINGFAHINKQKGHAFADNLLVAFSQILVSIFGEQVYRMSGDIFLVLDIGVSKDELKNKIETLRTEIKKYPLLDITVGYDWKKHAFDVRKLIEIVDNLRYLNKQKLYQKKGITKKHNALLAESIQFEIEDNQYAVFLQPKYNLQTGALASAEALIRKFDKNGNIISPVDFIPIYEREGVVDVIDLFVFETICRILKQWQEEGFDTNFTVAVNLSRASLARLDVAERLVYICETYGIKSDQINIEVTETIKADEDSVVSAMLHKIRGLGFGISLDDFGIGQSNFSILAETEFHEVKLDKSIIDKITFDEKSYILAKHLVNLCQDLKIPYIVAEGVETEDQAEVLKEIHCTLGQGYLFDKPMSLSDFAKKCLKKVSGVNVCKK